MSRVKSGDEHWKSKVKQKNIERFEKLIQKNPQMKQDLIAKKLKWSISTVRKHYQAWKEKQIDAWYEENTVFMNYSFEHLGNEAGLRAIYLECSADTGIRRGFCKNYLKEKLNWK